MVKNFKNNQYGIGEKHVVYVLEHKNHIVSPKFDTKRELNKWVKENQEYLKALIENKSDYYFEVIKLTEMYASKWVDMKTLWEGKIS